MSLSRSFYFPWFREDEYDFESMEGEPPYPAQVAAELAKDLRSWKKYVAADMLAALRRTPPERLEKESRYFKRLVEERLAEGYAMVVDF